MCDAAFECINSSQPPLTEGFKADSTMAMYVKGLNGLFQLVLVPVSPQFSHQRPQIADLDVPLVVWIEVPGKFRKLVNFARGVGD